MLSVYVLEHNHDDSSKPSTDIYTQFHKVPSASTEFRAHFHRSDNIIQRSADISWDMLPSLS